MSDERAERVRRFIKACEPDNPQRPWVEEGAEFMAGFQVVVHVPPRVYADVLEALDSLEQENETLRELSELRDEQAKDRYRDRNKARHELNRISDQLTALYEIVEEYLGHRHAQHEWRCDESECIYLARLAARSRLRCPDLPGHETHSPPCGWWMT